MTNDRLINISIGSSKKSTNWQPAQMLVSAFNEKLRTPTRGQETINEYLVMKKAAQDILKDIGGFVGGTLNGPRRKAANVTGRDLICLDADNIHAVGVFVNRKFPHPI